jgi:hypothetical protein
MRVAVIGSRSFNDYNSMYFTLNKIHIEQAPPDRFGAITEIISGGAKGADKLAERAAKALGIKLTIFEAKWDDMTEPCKKKINKFGKEYNALAGFNRNSLIIENADLIIAFWDGESSGTKDSIDKAKKLKKKVMIINFKN